MTDGSPGLLGESLAAASAAQPDAPAVITDGEATSYAELWSRALGVAGGVRDAAPPGSRVAHLAGNGPEYAIAYWGALLAGATTVELNPGLGDAELRAQLAHARPSILLGERAQLVRIAEPLAQEGAFAVHVPDPGATPVDAARRIPAALEGGRVPAAEPAPVDPSAVASVVYTSGTTGRPRGVCLRHASLAWTAGAIARSFGLDAPDPQERLLGALPLFYTYGKSVLHLATLLRSAIVFSRRLPSAPNLLRTLEAERVTHLSLVPFLGHLLLEAPGFCAEGLPALRRITVAGGALSGERLAELRRRFPGRVLPMYGLTEASTRVTCLPADEAEGRPDSCGRPLAGVEVRVVGEDGRSQPPGEEGEIQVRGPNVMAGYLDDPEASAAALADGWLRTGDLGRLDADGYLTVSGRLKDLIKVMGESVTAESVETAIAAHPDVAEVAVRGVPDVRTGEAIAAFVVPRAGASPGVEAIRSHCASLLGRARIPAHVRFLAALPRTASGKVRRHRLSLE